MSAFNHLYMVVVDRRLTDLTKYSLDAVGVWELAGIGQVDFATRSSAPVSMFLGFPWDTIQTMLMRTPEECPALCSAFNAEICVGQLHLPHCPITRDFIYQKVVGADDFDTHDGCQVPQGTQISKLPLIVPIDNDEVGTGYIWRTMSLN